MTDVTQTEGRGVACDARSEAREELSVEIRQYVRLARASQAKPRRSACGTAVFKRLRPFRPPPPPPPPPAPPP
ncbi:MAG: hypothetical protein LBK99_02430, partial [Opitutaceae bacterium]|nr:hypothetical protein [Opitutaceae bacterium]